MKIKQLLPIVLLAMCITPATYADNMSSATGTLDETLQLTIPDYINITETSGTKKELTSADFTIDTGYTTLSITNPMIFGYDVVANAPSQTLYLSATCTAEGSSVNALGGTKDAPRIVLTKDGASVTTGAVTSALANDDPDDNANAIALEFTPDCKVKTGSSGSITTQAIANNKIPYSITNGKYTLKYTSTGTASANTFSIKDESGTYKAIVNLTNSST